MIVLMTKKVLTSHKKPADGEVNTTVVKSSKHTSARKKKSEQSVPLEQKESISLRKKRLHDSLFIVGFIMAILLCLHFTLLRVFADPIGYGLNKWELATADKPEERALVWLENVEQQTKDLESIQEKMFIKNRTSAVVKRIIAADHAATEELIEAKNNGSDIKYHAKRLCENLEEQHTILSQIYADQQSLNEVSQLYTDVEQIRAAIGDVEAGINEAMQW